MRDILAFNEDSNASYLFKVMFFYLKNIFCFSLNVMLSYLDLNVFIFYAKC